jgi:FkbM family methyltransferase
MPSPSDEPGQAISHDARAFAETESRPPAVWDGEPVVSYTQNVEDVRLWRVFGKLDGGFYVDVGAGDPTNGSVTRLFSDHGWSGINIEPGPAFDALAEARPRDVNIRGVVGASEGPVQFFLTFPDLGMSTRDPSYHAHVPHAIDRIEEITVPSYRLERILREHAAERVIHFLKVDVEGSEGEVLGSSEWDVYRPIVVVVEAISPWSVTPTYERWEHILTDAGYEFAAFDGVNRFYVEGDHTDLIPTLAYPISALDRFVATSRIETRHADEEAQSAANEAERLRREVSRLEGEVERLRGYEGAVEAVLRSTTWRAGRFLVSLGSPVVAVARAAGLQRMRAPKKPPTPQEAFDEAVAEGAGWYFARGSITGSARGRRPDALERLAASFGPPGTEADDARVAGIAAELEQLDWAGDQSLLEKRLSWEQRQAVVETDAVVQLIRRLADESEPRLENATGASSSAVVIDTRCLQDSRFSIRGVGLHARSVFAAVRAAVGARTIVLLTTPELPELDRALLEPGDRIAATPYAVRDLAVDLFVQLSPMTAISGPAVPFLLTPSCSTVSVVYDFIPSTYPAAYLRSAADALANRARLEVLRRYDLLLPISSSTAAECSQLLGPTVRTVVTGIGNPLEEVQGSRLVARPPFVLVPGGGDPRKNVAVAIAALAQHRTAGGPALRAVVTGVLTGAQADGLRELAHRLGLPSESLELRGAVSEGELVALYRTAEVVVVGSIAEGFSIPVAEAILQGTPVVASDIAAHRELIGVGPWLAQESSVDGFAQAITVALRERDSFAARQLDALGDTATPAAVRGRLTAALESLLEDGQRRSATIARSARPRLAVVSPFPPQRSGVADYTARTFAQVAKYADVHVYTAETPGQSPEFQYRSLSAEPYLDGRFDSVINIVGNSHFHFAVMDLMASYGGACIAHDNRMIEAYLYDRGAPWTAKLVSRGSKSLNDDDLDAVLADLDRAPSIGYDIVARQASPLVVHGRALAERIRTETGVAPAVVPFVPYNVPRRPITEAERAQARHDLGLSDEVLHLATFGILDRRTKGVDLVVGACAWLRSWGTEAHLHLVGDGPAGERRALTELAEEIGVDGHVTQHGHVSRANLESHLLGVDVAVQLRTSAILSLSGAFADCIAFGVPTVATEDLAEEMDAPSYVARMGAETSALLVAEAVESLRTRRAERATSIEAERRDYLDRRSTDTYARNLLAALGLRPA